jgi:hypothetical protein
MSVTGAGLASPAVRTGTMRTSIPAVRNRFATHLVWARARALPRVPNRNTGRHDIIDITLFPRD